MTPSLYIEDQNLEDIFLDVIEISNPVVLNIGKGYLHKKLKSHLIDDKFLPRKIDSYIRWEFQTNNRSQYFHVFNTNKEFQDIRKLNKSKNSKKYLTTYRINWTYPKDLLSRDFENYKKMIDRSIDRLHNLFDCDIEIFNYRTHGVCYVWMS